ncbi:MAG: TrkA family potassium uptake protein [Verrucomicrobia bacterium]|nr:TrkA family potassium uptake protein [Verrucomicrobiota bacterium]MCF7709029.1 TrkA family potassium uptake protein [Verrucomicrobiota bacterium]
MSRRIFILGAGRFGTHLATRLSEFGCEVIIADSNPERVEDLSEDGFNAVELDADDETALQAAGVQQADAVVVAIGENMQASILATLLLKQMRVKKVVTRAIDVKHAQVLAKLGANLVVVPSRDMAYRLAERLMTDSLTDRLPLSGEYQLARIRLGPFLDGKTIAEAKLPVNYNVTIVLINRHIDNSEPETMEPLADVVLRENDELLVVGTRDHINEFDAKTGIANEE